MLPAAAVPVPATTASCSVKVWPAATNTVAAQNRNAAHAVFKAVRKESLKSVVIGDLRGARSKISLKQIQAWGGTPRMRKLWMPRTGAGGRSGLRISSVGRYSSKVSVNEILYLHGVLAPHDCWNGHCAENCHSCHVRHPCC